MRRREFISLLGGATVAWPLAARAQQPLPIVGYINSGAPGPMAPLVSAFHEGLSQAGYVEGRNVAVEYRWSEGRSDRLPDLAADLVRRGVAVIVAVGGSGPAQAAKDATTTIPIVFVSGDDAIEAGLVNSLGQPTGNVTGISWLASSLEAKRFGLLRELIPDGDFGVMVNPNFPGGRVHARDAQEAARDLGIRVQVLNVSSERDLEAIFATLREQKLGGLVVNPNPMFYSLREQIVMLAARHAVPTIYYTRDYAVAGGLMSYGTSVREAARQGGVYAGRVLKGDKPADLPVLQPTKFEFVINLKTAKALGLKLPSGVLAIADEVIE
ncbi:MAG TPA: ABC transporter substrate-binding protein [Micropepsaceae bacterium]|nr:ABC transporter substrate-binding protein [Micropepsaceae bacterium]